MEMAKWGVSTIESKVKDIKILANAASLGHLLLVPIDEVDRLEDKCSGLKIIFEREDVVAFKEILASHLSIEMRLLHHLMARIFLP